MNDYQDSSQSEICPLFAAFAGHFDKSIPFIAKKQLRVLQLASQGDQEHSAVYACSGVYALAMNASSAVNAWKHISLPY